PRSHSWRWGRPSALKSAWLRQEHGSRLLRSALAGCGGGHLALQAAVGPEFPQVGDVVVEGAGADAEQFGDGGHTGVGVGQHVPVAGLGADAVADHRPMYLELRVHRVRRVPDRRPHLGIVAYFGVGGNWDGLRRLRYHRTSVPDGKSSTRPTSW